MSEQRWCRWVLESAQAPLVLAAAALQGAQPLVLWGTLVPQCRQQAQVLKRWWHRWDLQLEWQCWGRG